MPLMSPPALDRATPARIVFMGTPDFAIPTLRALIAAQVDASVWPGGLRVVGVVTRPDKPAGRGQRVIFSPIKQAAADSGVAVLQPGPLRAPGALESLTSLEPHLVVVAAFGQILPPGVLDLPSHGCLIVHASLLPRWRGAAPVAAAIRAGDAQTGVTIMAMDTGLDTGAIVSARTTPITRSDTAGALTTRLAALGARLLIETLPSWLSGTAPQTPQDDRQATLTRPLRKEDGRLDWSLRADALERLTRAMSPWPGVFTTWNGKILKVLEVETMAAPMGLQAGSCFVAPDRSLACACGEGALALRVIQLEGKRAMTSAEMLRGQPALAGATLGA